MSFLFSSPFNEHLMCRNSNHLRPIETLHFLLWLFVFVLFVTICFYLSYLRLESDRLFSRCLLKCELFFKSLFSSIEDQMVRWDLFVEWFNVRLLLFCFKRINWWWALFRRDDLFPLPSPHILALARPPPFFFVLIDPWIERSFIFKLSLLDIGSTPPTLHWTLRVPIVLHISRVIH